MGCSRAVLRPPSASAGASDHEGHRAAASLLQRGGSAESCILTDCWMRKLPGGGGKKVHWLLLPGSQFSASAFGKKETPGDETSQEGARGEQANEKHIS